MPSPKVFVSAVLNITCCYSHTLTTIGKKADLSYIKRGMVLGAKCTGLSISETIVNVNALRKKMACWCQMSEENGQITSVCQNSNNACIHAEENL